MKTLIEWFRVLLSGEPHFYIGGRDDPYMLRWYLIPRNRWLNLYLHKFMRDDDDRALHDHPWNFVSIMLWGQYTEITAMGTAGKVRGFPDVAFRSAEHRHRVVLDERNGQPVPCWTLVFTGPKVREWGFWYPKGFVPWQDFVAHDDHGNIGKGCE